jgi:hypothetical protein
VSGAKQALSMACVALFVSSQLSNAAPGFKECQTNRQQPDGPCYSTTHECPAPAKSNDAKCKVKCSSFGRRRSFYWSASFIPVSPILRHNCLSTLQVTTLSSSSSVSPVQGGGPPLILSLEVVSWLVAPTTLVGTCLVSHIFHRALFHECMLS